MTGSDYGIILQNDIMEEIGLNHLYGKDPGDARDVPGAPWDLRDPLGTRPGPPGTSLGSTGTPLGPPRDAPSTPRDAPGTPGYAPGTPEGRPWDPTDSYGPQKRQYLDKYTAPEAFDCCVRTCSSGPIA